jgi:DNA transformation protein
MPVTASYLTFVLDQLSGLRGVSSRRMFGGVGLYQDGLFFGAIDDDVMFLRVDDATRPEFTQRGSQALRPVASKPDMVMEAYYQVPGDILDDPESLHQWAQRAIAIARANPTAKQRKAGAGAKATKQRAPAGKSAGAHGKQPKKAQKTASAARKSSRRS